MDTPVKTPYHTQCDDDTILSRTTKDLSTKP